MGRNQKLPWIEIASAMGDGASEEAPLPNLVASGTFELEGAPALVEVIRNRGICTSGKVHSFNHCSYLQLLTVF